MAKMVPAWDKRTGRKLPNLVPKRWLDKGTFPNLADKPPAAPKSATPADDWTVDDLRSYADTHGIDLAGATKKADVLAAVQKGA